MFPSEHISFVSYPFPFRITTSDLDTGRSAVVEIPFRGSSDIIRSIRVIQCVKIVLI